MDKDTVQEAIDRFVGYWTADKWGEYLKISTAISGGDSVGGWSNYTQNDISWFISEYPTEAAYPETKITYDMWKNADNATREFWGRISGIEWCIFAL